MIGGEAAGVVLEVGEGHSDLVVGDRVMGLMADAFGPVGVAEPEVLVRVPDGWSFAEAASVPIVFFTAYYAFVDLAGLRAGESVLSSWCCWWCWGWPRCRSRLILVLRCLLRRILMKWETLRGLGIR